jgi:hypothetical protein
VPEVAVESDDGHIYRNEMAEYLVGRVDEADRHLIENISSQLSSEAKEWTYQDLIDKTGISKLEHIDPGFARHAGLHLPFLNDLLLAWDWLALMSKYGWHGCVSIKPNGLLEASDIIRNAEEKNASKTTPLGNMRVLANKGITEDGKARFWDRFKRGELRLPDADLARVSVPVPESTSTDGVDHPQGLCFDDATSARKASSGDLADGNKLGA